MFNFDWGTLENLDRLKDLENVQSLKGLMGIAGSIGVLFFFFALIFLIGVIILLVFSCIGLMNEGKKNNIPNSWLAFFPIGRSYVIGKLGFEVYGEDKKNGKNLALVTLGLGAAAFILADSTGDLSKLISLGLLVFQSWAFYNIFKGLKMKNTVLYTVFTVITNTALGGLFLYINKEDNYQYEKPTEEVKETKKETKKEENNYCQYCGNKLIKNAKFCPECGKKIN